MSRLINIIHFYTIFYSGINELPYEVYEYIKKDRYIINNGFKNLKKEFEDFELFEECNACLYTYVHDNLSECCANGYLNLLKYFHIRENFNFNNDINNIIQGEILKNGHLDCLEYIHKNGPRLTLLSLHIAIDFDKVECLNYILNNGFSLNADFFNYSSKTGSMECLKYLHEKNALLMTIYLHFQLMIKILNVWNI